MKPHADYERLRRLWPTVERLQRLARRHGIRDVFQDNGGKLLQVLLLTGLQGLAAREGNDACDAEGRQYELKSVNIELTQSVSTHHHLNRTIIDKYRRVRWVIAIYRGITLEEIWMLEPEDLEDCFSKWETKWRETQKDINNPKIALSLVRSRGRRYFPLASDRG